MALRSCASRAQRPTWCLCPQAQPLRPLATARLRAQGLCAARLRRGEDGKPPTSRPKQGHPPRSDCNTRMCGARRTATPTLASMEVTRTCAVGLDPRPAATVSVPQPVGPVMAPAGSAASLAARPSNAVPAYRKTAPPSRPATPTATSGHARRSQAPRRVGHACATTTTLSQSTARLASASSQHSFVVA